MKNLALILLICWNSMGGQTIQPGVYNCGLNLAYDKASGLVTGYYENHTGWDEKANAPRFTCSFYIQGNFDEQNSKITTYSPLYKSDDSIDGILSITANNTISLQLNDEHGGCWNVENFKPRPVSFTLATKSEWLQVRYIATDKSYFYNSPAESAKRKSYVVKGDIIYVEKIQGEWAYCTYFGSKPVTYWLKVPDLNKLTN